MKYKFIFLYPENCDTEWYFGDEKLRPTTRRKGYIFKL